MDPRIEAVLSGVMTISAVAVASTYVYQQVVAPDAPPSRRAPPVYYDGWDSLVRGGVRVGSAEAPVQIVEFADFQCPFCKTLHDAVEQLSAELPGQVAIVHYDFPLSNHAHAEPAAWAASCAHDQGRFREKVRTLYAHQDSIGKKAWTVYADEAGIPDSARFSDCLRDNATHARVAEDAALAKRLSVSFTPTIFINGWQYRVPLGVDSLKSLAREIAGGRTPFPRRRR